jgi:hypothetical protein
MRKTSVVIALLLFGCASSPHKQPLTAQQLCVAAQPKPWVLISAPPDASDQLIALADAHPVFPNSSAVPPVKSWFRSADGEVLLCRHDNAGCIGEWWIYRSESDGWKIKKSDGWICVT